MTRVPVLGRMAAPQLDHGGENIHQAGGLVDHSAGRQHPRPAEDPRHADAAFPAPHPFATCKEVLLEFSKRWSHPHAHLCTPVCLCTCLVTPHINTQDGSLHFPKMSATINSRTSSLPYGQVESTCSSFKIWQVFATTGTHRVCNAWLQNYNGGLNFTPCTAGGSCLPLSFFLLEGPGIGYGSPFFSSSRTCSPYHPPVPLPPFLVHLHFWDP